MKPHRKIRDAVKSGQIGNTTLRKIIKEVKVMKAEQLLRDKIRKEIDDFMKRAKIKDEEEYSNLILDVLYSLTKEYVDPWFILEAELGDPSFQKELIERIKDRLFNEYM